LEKILDTVGLRFEHASLGSILRHDFMGRPICIRLKTIAMVPSLPTPAPESHRSTILLRPEDKDKALELVSLLAQELDCELVWRGGAFTHHTNASNFVYPSRAIQFLLHENRFEPVVVDTSQFLCFSFMLLPKEGQQAVYSKTNAMRVVDSWVKICSTPEKIAAIESASKELSRMGAAAVEEYKSAIETRRSQKAAAAAAKDALVSKAQGALRAALGSDRGTRCRVLLEDQSAEVTVGTLALSSTFIEKNRDEPSDKDCDRIAESLQAKLTDGVSTSIKPEIRVDAEFEGINIFLSSRRSMSLREAAGLSLRISLPYQIFDELQPNELAKLVGKAKAILNAPIES
jgi:hypothetical protein